jgi:hypothetical protein
MDPDVAGAGGAHLAECDLLRGGRHAGIVARPSYHSKRKSRPTAALCHLASAGLITANTMDIDKPIANSDRVIGVPGNRRHSSCHLVFRCGPASTHLVFPVRPQRCLQGRAMASYQSVPQSVNHLTGAERADLVEVSRKVRPNARQRRQFAELRQARGELNAAAEPVERRISGWSASK